MLFEQVTLCEDSVASRALAAALGFLIHLVKLAERSNCERLIFALYGAALVARQLRLLRVTTFVRDVFRQIT